MFRLTREVRFAAVEDPDQPFDGKPSNSYAGFPTLRGFAPWLSLQVTVAGDLEPASGYLVNIKQIDSSARKLAMPIVARAVSTKTPPERTIADVFDRLKESWPGLTL